MGNLRTAVLAWLFARSTGRRFLLRIEDLDPGRVRSGLAERQVGDLEALGIFFDGEPVVQSRRSAAYAAALDALGERTYECFCSRREIAEAAAAPHGTLPHYPGTCRNLTQTQRAERRRIRPPALRLHGDGATQTVRDTLHGTVSGPVSDIVLRRNDGLAAYHLAVVVDDGDAGVDQVVRGEDLLDAAPSQAYLAGLLGYPSPAYAHVPLVVNSAGQRLAKRDGAVTLADLSAEGVKPGEVLAAIAKSLGLASPGEQVALPTLLNRFDPGRLPRSPWVFQGLGSSA